MKKIIICLLIIFIMMMSCACSQEERVYTEIQGDLQITYTYSKDCILLMSKSVYDASTGITTEYCYFYENTGWGALVVGMSVVTIKNGQIIDGLEAHK